MGSAMSVTNFISDIEQYIYEKELIYRTLLVSSNHKESLQLKRELKKKDYSVLYIKDVRDMQSIDDYDRIDERVVVISAYIFKDFVEYMEDISKSSYNFIGFSYAIPEDIKQDILSFYVCKTQNNSNSTILFDKNYMRLIYLNSVKK